VCSKEIPIFLRHGEDVRKARGGLRFDLTNAVYEALPPLTYVREQLVLDLVADEKPWLAEPRARYGRTEDHVAHNNVRAAQGRAQPARNQPAAHQPVLPDSRIAETPENCLSDSESEAKVRLLDQPVFNLVAAPKSLWREMIVFPAAPEAVDQDLVAGPGQRPRNAARSDLGSGLFGANPEAADNYDARQMSITKAGTALTWKKLLYPIWQFEVSDKMPLKIARRSARSSTLAT